MHDLSPDVTHFVVDIETLATPSRDTPAHLVPIATIGIVAFRLGDASPWKEFYARLPWTTENSDVATLKWWLQQSHEARAEIFGEPTGSLNQVTEFFHDNAEPSNTRVWGNSPSFDLSILGPNLPRRSGAPVWAYTQERDVRTLRNTLPMSVQGLLGCVPFEGVRHHALHDARHEARLVRSILRIAAGNEATGRDAASHTALTSESKP